MTRVFSGIQPSGEVHLGNYLGAIRNFVADQHEHDSFFCIVDLHALTVPQDPAMLRQKTVELANLYLACGLDPEICTLFVQGHVHEHCELAWLLECTASFGELRRMTQFKDKSESTEFVSAALLTYPALMAADILLYAADRVPVGEDQRQHLELTRDVGARFNARYGDTFVLPEAAIPKVGAKVMDLQTPTAKMSKSSDSPQGTVLLLDEPTVIERKIKRAVTDTDSEVRFDPAAKPGVANLLSMLGTATGEDPAALATRYSQYGPLKADTAAALIEVLRPVQARYAELVSDPATTAKILQQGAEKAQAVAAGTLARARDAMGLLPHGGSMSADAVATALQIVGYPTSIVVIARWVPVVRERRAAWFVTHQVALAAIVAGWVIKGDRTASLVNGTWLVVATVWFGLGGRRRRLERVTNVAVVILYLRRGLGG